MDETLTGLALPPLLSVAIQPTWSKSHQALAALLLCLAVAIAQNAHNLDDIPKSLTKIVTAMFVSYKAFYEPTGLADAIESRTNFDNE